MADGQDITVHIEGLPPMHFPLGTSQEVIQAAVKKQVAGRKVEGPEGVGTKIARGATLGAFSGAGIPETQDPLGDLAKNLGKQAGDLFGVYRHPLSGEAWKRSLAANPLVAIPRALGTTGVDVLKDVYGGGKRGGIGNIDPEKLSHDAASLLTQILLLRGGKKAAETPISEGAVAKTVGETAKRTGREFLGISEPAEKAARAETEEGIQKKITQYAAKREEAAAKDIEKAEGVREKKAAEVREAQAQRIGRSKLETKKAGLGVLEDRVAEKVADNLDRTEKAHQASLNKRYAPFNRVIDMGKFDLAELETAIEETRKELFKGTVQNEPIFNSILSRIKNKVEAPSGEVRAVPGENMIRGDQLRGYISELGNEMFRNTELPADIYKGLKNVREAAKAMVQDYVEDAMGKAGGEAYRQLQRDWSKYEQIWYDRGSGSPLRNALKTIRTTGRNVSVYREVANQLLRQVKGEQALEWLGKVKAFGGNPDLLAQLRRVDREMKAIKVPGEMAEVEPPTLPKPTEVKTPEIEHFEPERWRRQTIKDIAKPLGRPTGWDVAAIGYALREIVKGKFPWGLTYPVGKRVLQYLTENPKVVDWLTKEQP